MNIYVSSLSPSTTEQALKELFSTVGEVSSVKIINDRFTGTSRGFAFIDMPDDNAGQQALDNLNNAELDGKLISVKLARPKEENSGSFQPRGGSNFRKF
ncbi:MAG TPA: hypothetical protein VM888_13185 [Chitinophagaceae bacterium]|jgi:RNA recognition motif-containing protein|nr:hypothetical protein [Chitinophagaceae bacterium]